MWAIKEKIARELIGRKEKNWKESVLSGQGGKQPPLNNAPVDIVEEMNGKKEAEKKMKSTKENGHQIKN